jgi:uncharacterized protein YjeT (DUF2065 family)
MSDILVAIGLLFALEGALYALFPGAMKRLAAQALETPADTLRLAGVAGVALGVALVWLVRG